MWFMLENIIVSLLTIALLITAMPAQETNKLSRIRILELASPSAGAEGYRPLRQGLRELGYIEGTNVPIEYLLARPDKVIK